MKKVYMIIGISSICIYNAEGLIVNRMQRRDARRSKQQQSGTSTPLAPTTDTLPQTEAAEPAVAMPSYGIIAPLDREQLQQNFSIQLAAQGDAQIKKMRRASDPAFTPSEQFIKKQRMAREQLTKNVVPRITQAKALHTETGTPLKARCIDLHTIDQLSPSDLKRCLTALANALTLLPCVPGSADAWAKALTPLFSFTANAQGECGDLMASWLSQMLANVDDFKRILTLSKMSSEQDKAKEIAALRKKYQEYSHNASQLLYAWVQIASIINPESPVKTFLQYATRDWQTLYTQYNALVDIALQHIKAPKGAAHTRKDASGLLLLTLQTLFAPASWETFIKDTSAEQVDSDI